MPDIKKLQDKSGNEFYPRTVLNAVYDTNTGKALSNGVPASRYRTLTVDNPISDSSLFGYGYSQTFTWDNVLATDNASMGIVTGYSTDNVYAVETKADAVKLYFDEDPTDAVVIVYVYPATTGTLEDNAASEIEARVTALELGDVYSTTEHVVGRWIDSKPLYQKTLSLNMPSSITDGTTAFNYYSFSSLGLNDSYDTMWIYDGFIIYPRGDITTLWRVWNDGTSCTDAIVDLTNSTINIGSSRSNMANRPVYVTIRYTKTTN